MSGIARRAAAFSVRIPQQTRKQLDDMAEATGRSRNSVIAEAVEIYMAKQMAHRRAIETAVDNFRDK